MSTRIDSGLRFLEPLGGLLALQSIIPDLLEMATVDALSDSAHDIAAYVDQYNVQEQSPVRHAAELRRGRETPHAMYANIHFFSDQRTRTLAVYPTGPQEAYDLVKNLPGAAEYGYWNNTDRPDHVTEQQWLEREAFWNRVFPNAGPIHVPSISIPHSRASVLSPENHERLLALLPDRKTRAGRAAVNLAAREIPKERIISRIMSMSRDASAPGSPLNALAIAVRPLLTEVTADTLVAENLETSISVERHPELRPLIDAAAAAVDADDN
jgi:hypothetical protein